MNTVIRFVYDYLNLYFMNLCIWPQFLIGEDCVTKITTSLLLKRLYGHIDNLELYTGLQCEATIPTGPGLWLPAGYTMMKAILSDAIALVRGDRFYTSSFTPSNLIAWGYQDTKREPNNSGLGGAFPKLLTRHLPHHYTFVSFWCSNCH